MANLDRDYGGAGEVNFEPRAQAAIAQFLGEAPTTPRAPATPISDANAAVAKFLGPAHSQDVVDRFLAGSPPPEGNVMGLVKAMASPSRLITTSAPEGLTPVQEALYYGSLAPMGPVPFPGSTAATVLAHELAVKPLTEKYIPETTKIKGVFPATGFEEAGDVTESTIPLRTFAQVVADLGLGVGFQTIGRRLLGLTGEVGSPVFQTPITRPAPPLRSLGATPEEVAASLIRPSAPTRLALPPVVGDKVRPAAVFGRAEEFGTHPLDEMPTQRELANAYAITVPPAKEPQVLGARPVGGAEVTPSRQPGLRFDKRMIVDGSTGKILGYTSDDGSFFNGANRPLGSIPNSLGEQAGGAGIPKIEGPKLSARTGEVPSGGLDLSAAEAAIHNPNVPFGPQPQQTFFDRMRRWLDRSIGWDPFARYSKERLPAEYQVYKEAPESTVLSDLAQHRGDLQARAAKLYTGDEAKALWREDPAKIWDAEHKASMRFINEMLGPEARNMEPNAARKLIIERVKSGEIGIERYQAAYNRSMAEFTPAMRQQSAIRENLFDKAQDAAHYFRQQWLPEELGPYWPRLIDRGAQQVLRIKRGETLGSHYATTVGSFEQGREHVSALYGTYKTNAAYLDPRRSMALRNWKDSELIATADMFKRMEANGVIYRGRDAAQEAMTAAGVPGTPWKVEGTPGIDHWYTKYRVEAQALADNLRPRDSNSWTHAMNILLRGTNLVDPFPHTLKNMPALYFQAGGSVVKAPYYILEYTANLNHSRVASFENLLGHGAYTQPASKYLYDYINRDMISKLIHGIEGLNKFSNYMTFKMGDPSLKYALWRTFVGQGMSEQAAANKVFGKMIEYSARSQTLDTLKNIPLNFFATWRLGATAATISNFAERPIRTALFVGLVDYVREAEYRSSGRWTPLPWDHLEGPVARAIYERDPVALGILGASMFAFGPGAGAAATTMTSLLRLEKDPTEWERLKHLFWGFSQIVDLPKQYALYEKTGDPRHLGNMLATFAIGEHDAYYKPHRLFEGFSEEWPGMEKSQKVRDIERLIERQTQARERARERAIERGHPYSIREVIQRREARGQYAQ